MLADITEKKGRDLVVKGRTTPTFEALITSCNILGVRVGTTGYKGGDSGYGGRSYFEICNIASSDITAEKTKDGISLSFGGDTELDTLITALEYGAAKLREMADIKEKSRQEQQEQMFQFYLWDLLALYRSTGKLSGMSELQKKYHVAALTKSQFFELNLHEAAKAEAYLHEDYCSKVYDYVKSKNKSKAPVWTN